MSNFISWFRPSTVIKQVDIDEYKTLWIHNKWLFLYYVEIVTLDFRAMENAHRMNKYIKRKHIATTLTYEKAEYHMARYLLEHGK